jgi:hypothetical protein
MKKSRHHYVPRFYLKNFASNTELADTKQINLYNIDKQIIINNVSLKEQCYKHKFYGKNDDIENMLAKLESKFAVITRKILATKTLPSRDAGEFAMILFFVALQMIRTKRMAEDFNSFIEKFNQIILLRNKENFNLTAEKIKEMKIGIKDPMLILIHSAIKFFLSIDDLKLILLVSDCECNFITSDAPVFMYNKYCEGSAGATTGLIAAGTQIFFPLSPRICLHLYDGNVYKVGKKSGNIVSITSATDIDRINTIQFIGADNNLYFSNNHDIKYFQDIHSRFIKRRIAYGPKVLEFAEEGISNKSTIVNYHNVPNLGLNLSFISIRKAARKIKLLDRVTLYRRPMPLVPGEEPRPYGDLPRDYSGKVLKKINEL